MSRFLRNQGWVAGLFALLIFLFVVTKLIQPGYGSGDFGSLARAVLPYAFAVAAQTWPSAVTAVPAQPQMPPPP